MDSLSTLHHQHCIVNRLHQATESESTGLMVGSWGDSASMGRSLRGHLFLHAEAAVARVQRMQALSQKLHWPLSEVARLLWLLRVLSPHLAGLGCVSQMEASVIYGCTRVRPDLKGK